jgi:glycosyltransferase involved in cell wall biosynthesis
MKRIAWVTVSSFIDVDLPIVKSLNLDSELDITWYLIFVKNRISDYDINALHKEVCTESVRINCLFLKNRLSSIITLYKLFILLFKIRFNNPDILYLDCEMEPYFSILVRFFFNPKKVIIAIHDVEPHYGISKIFHIFLYFKIKIFSNFQVFSKTQKNIFASKYKNKNIFCIPLFLKSFGKSKMVVENDKIYFLFFGTIRQNKGIEYLIEAANKLALSHKGKFVVKIAGKCNEWIFYENKISDKNVFDFYIQAVPNAKIADLFCQSHYIVLPYKDVTQSGPLMLAFNYGIIPIASNLPGFREHIIDHETGYLFKTEDSGSLYNVMCKIIDSKNVNYNVVKNNLLRNVSNKYSINEIKFSYIEMFKSINN